MEEKGSEKIFEDIIFESFPNMRKKIVNQVQELQRVPYRIKSRGNTLRHILVKLPKIKHTEKIAINLWIHEFCLNKIITSYILQCFMLYKAISHHHNRF